MNRWTGKPAYLQIAADYRTRILDGRLPGGAKLPSETELMQRYDVSRIVAKMAIGVLRGEGLVVSRQGKGSFVRAVRRIVRDSRRYSRRPPPDQLPFQGDTALAARQGRWEHASREVRASADIAHRLHLQLEAPVMRTRYRYVVDDEPVALYVSSEPLEVTRSTPVERPECSPHSGVIARFDSIGITVDSVVERVTARAAVPAESRRLRLPAPGAYVLAIQRTHFAGDRPVETCDIVLPGDRYESTYHLQVD
ncbi:MAG TPA: GntR family transcriptional regulator [Actinopolymorphaceae bacterium]